jgi:glycerol kinase
VFVGGAVVQWLRDGLGLIERAAEVEALAASVPDTAASARAGLHRPRQPALGPARARRDRRPHARQHARRTSRARRSSRSRCRARTAAGDAGDDAAPAAAELRVDGGATAPTTC